MALRAIQVLRESLAALRTLVSEHEELGGLTDWLPALSAKVDAFSEAIVTGAAPRLPPWHSGEFARQVRTESRLTESLARAVLSHLREVEAETNRVVRALARQRPAPEALLRLLGAMAGDVVSIQSALYGRFPHLEADAEKSRGR